MATDPVQISPHEALRDPLLVLAYAGWNDGGEAASHALTFLIESLEVQKVATLETEEFLDFTVVRPRIRAATAHRREIVWPDHEFFCARSEAQPFDLVVGLGVEPHLRWRAYSAALCELVAGLGIRRVVLFGAYLDDVIYSQPVQVLGSANDPDLQRQLGGDSGGYQGPTGIVGVLGHSLEQAGFDVISLWAALPHYVSCTPNPRASLALLQKFDALLGYRLDLSRLTSDAGEFDRKVSELVAGDPQLVAYVRELKKRAFSQ